MNQLCKVCGEPAAGFHFGAFTCEGCKSFFGRTYNNLSSISECKNNGECVINKKNRTACKACRLRKCLLVGMSKSGSRYGRRSNWFKIHCLLQEQQQAGATFAAAAGLLRPQPYLPLFRTPPPASTTRDTRSSSSDSGASSADPEDDSRSLPYKPPHSPASLPEFYPSSRAIATDSTECARRQLAALARRMPSVSPAPQPKWLPPPLGVADPSAWRDLWLAGAAPLPAPEPDQEQPIDLSVKPGADAVKPGLEPTGRNSVKPDVEGEIGGQRGLCVGLEVEDGGKTVPLDLTLDRQSACSKTNACSN